MRLVAVRLGKLFVFHHRRSTAPVTRPRILSLIGEYFPEMSGGGLQLREMIHALRGHVEFSVLATSSLTDAFEAIEGIPVYRVRVDTTRRLAQIRMLARFLRLFARLARTVDVVHLHGVTRKNIAVTTVARLFGKPVMLTLHNGGHDDVATIRAQRSGLFWSVRHAQRVVAVCDALRDAAASAGIPSITIPNGVDMCRFHPLVDASEQQALRQRLSLPVGKRLILFVGFFSRDKGPDRLFAAWRRLPLILRTETQLVFVGQTRGAHREVDPRLADHIQRMAEREDAAPIFIERTAAIEQYYQASDVFVLASTREGCPVALLEAMATGLPVVASRLPGCTDTIIHDGVNGRLFAAGDVDDLSAALVSVLTDMKQARSLATNARLTVSRSYSIKQTATVYETLYRSLMPST